MKRILIAGTHSGSGKTTVTCALLSLLKGRGHSPAAFKCGPDFIDPMFHRAVTGIPCWNLDPFFLDGGGLRAHLSRHGRRGSISVIEGVMGFYDGIAATTRASTWTVAAETETPVVLVVDVSGAGNSVAAIIEGFVRYRRDSGIAGVIFNGASSSSWPWFRVLAEESGVRALGYLPRNEDWSLGSRHLGLVTAAEIPGLQEKLAVLGRQAGETIDLEGLLDLAGTAPELPPAEGRGDTVHDRKLRIAVARDEAFCFIYEENLELFAELGAEPVFFSPLRDEALPPDICGLYLPGGYPELHCRELSDNAGMRAALRRALEGGLPAIAECGGFLYLHETLDGFPMTGVIPAAAFRTEKLRRFGYVTLTAREDNLLCAKGESIPSHEFHYWESAAPGNDFTGRKPGRETEYSCVHATESLYAGFPHLYFAANRNFAVRFIEKCGQYHCSA